MENSSLGVSPQWYTLLNVLLQHVFTSDLTVQGWQSLLRYTSHKHTCRVFRCLRVLECICLPMYQGQQVPALLWEVWLYHPKASGVLQTQENALPRQDRCANPSSVSRPFYSLTGKTAKTHFQIGNWINIKNIYTCISTIYHTALIKSGFLGGAGGLQIPLFYLKVCIFFWCTDL